MTCVKLVSTDDCQWQDSPVTLLNQWSRGVEQSRGVKVANELAEAFDGMTAKEGHTLVHVLAVGSTEAYGPNRNGDGFRRSENKLAHPRFVKQAHVFLNHKNKDPKKAVGSIKMSSYNDEMDRIELILELDNEKCAKHIQKLHEGKDLKTSMGCFTDPETPVLTSCGYKRIADIVVGDLVHTHQGRFRRVTETHRRKWSGDLVTVRVRGLPFPIQVTSDHPWYAKCFQLGSDERAPPPGSKKFDEAPEGWVHSEHLGKGDLFYHRVVEAPKGTASIADPDLAKLLGFYLAEGSLSYNTHKDGKKVPSSVYFTSNIEDDIPGTVSSIFAKTWPEVTVGHYPKPNSKFAISCVVNNSDFASYCRFLVGVGVRNKSIPWEIFASEDSIKKEFLAAWFSGDGVADAKGAHWSTCSRSLALQGRDLLATLGIPSSIYQIRHKAGSGFSSSDTTEYTLNIGLRECRWLAEYDYEKSKSLRSYSEGALEGQKAATSMRDIDDQPRYAQAVTSVEISAADDVATYNIEVEEDESYLAYGLVSHNCKIAHDVCSICGHHAPTPDDWCVHAKTAMTRILDDGRQVFVDNPNPHYFDESLVGRPADRIAYHFGAKLAADSVLNSWELAHEAGLYLPGGTKVASFDQNILIQKLAEMEKQVEMNLTPADSALGAASCGSSDMDEDEAKSLRDNGIAESLSGLSDKQIILPVEDFLKIVSSDDDDLSDIAGDVKSHLPGIFGDKGNDLMPELFETDGGVPSELNGLVERLNNQVGMGDAPLDGRISVTVIKGTESKPVEKAEKNSSDQTAAAGLAKLYASYKLAALTNPINGDDPLICRAALLQHYRVL